MPNDEALGTNPDNEADAAQELLEQQPLGQRRDEALAANPDTEAEEAQRDLEQRHAAEDD